MIEGLLILAALFAVLAFGAYITDDHNHTPPRVDNRIPQKEYDLLGDDWRAHCVDYADIRRSRHIIIFQHKQTTERSNNGKADRST